MQATETGIPAPELDDVELERELRHLHQTREETFFNGSAQALDMHTKRMLEMEAEYARRFPDRTEPEAARTREGSRERAGQPPKIRER
jgi:hypothetical protein